MYACMHVCIYLLIQLTLAICTSFVHQLVQIAYFSFVQFIFCDVFTVCHSVCTVISCMLIDQLLF